MQDDPETILEPVAKQIATLRLIIGAMLMGLVTFAVIVLVMNGTPAGQGEMLTKMGLLMGLIALVAQQVISRVVLDQQVAQLKLDRNASQNAVSLMQAYFTSTLVSAAILEGAALLNLIALFIERATLSLGMAALLLAALLLTKFPRKYRIASWMSKTLRTANELGSLKKR